ncbi:MAG: cytochrome c oxidase accessory protein CcoG [Gammaproteobacteria bacterium]|jgi:cytochrome c oxidase accessory protein FixG
MSESTESLFEGRIPIYPRSVKGRFRYIKWGVLALAYGVYFLLPWIRWARPTGPDQAVLFDLNTRLFYIFGLVVHPQDIFWLAGFLLLAALLLFFVTGILGRVFCGYFCFQTLWTDVFIMVERLVQGERPARIRLAKQPWNFEKIFKLGATHVLWLLVAMLTGLTFTLYWADAPQLTLQFFTGKAPFPAYATTAFLTATTYVMAGLAREQVCTYMCPYARFQSVMFDRDTLIVSYDQGRGEGQAGRHKVNKQLKTHDQRQAAGVGDCIDCGYCVQVCPTGIDIRNGLQVSCIHCALCVDACDNIMDNMGWPRGLIRYTSENELEGKKTRFLKGKTFGYGAAIAIVLGLLLWSMTHSTKYDAVSRQIRQPLYVVMSDGSIQNSYELKINNKTQSPLTLTVGLDGLKGAVLDVGNFKNFTIPPEQYLRVLVRVRFPGNTATPEDHDFSFVLTPQNGKIPPIKVPARFYTP